LASTGLVLLDYDREKDRELDQVLQNLRNDLINAGFHAQFKKIPGAPCFPAPWANIIVWFETGPPLAAFLGAIGADIYAEGKKRWHPVKQALMNLHSNLTLTSKNRLFTIHVASTSHWHDPDSQVYARIGIADGQPIRQDEWESGLDCFSNALYPAIRKILFEDKTSTTTLHLTHTEGRWFGDAEVRQLKRNGWNRIRVYLGIEKKKAIILPEEEERQC